MPKDGLLRLTIKKSGDFTARINEIPVGTLVWVEGPYGAFTAAPRHKTKFLFIAGGVGITPIRAMIGELAPEHDIVLIYGSQRSNSIILKDELEGIAERHPFPRHYVMSEEASFAGEQGRVDQEKIARLVPDILEREVFLCGPPPMMAGVRRALRAIGLPENCLHFERFAL